jgi:D-3-phosphoglycerate dehydrogenase / 2-oxoglutarate reductase
VLASIVAVRASVLSSSMGRYCGSLRSTTYGRYVSWGSTSGYFLASIPFSTVCSRCIVPFLRTSSLALAFPIPFLFVALSLEIDVLCVPRTPAPIPSAAMSKIPVYVLDPYHPDAIDLLQRAPNVQPTLPGDPAKHEWHKHASAIMIRSETQIADVDFSKAKKLSLVVKQGVGVDNIDLDAARKHGVKVYNTPALNAESVAELSMTLALCISRRIVEMDRRLLRGEKVIRSQTLALSLFQKTIGIVGMGNIGKETAKKWIAAFDAQIIGYDPYTTDEAWADIPHRRAQSLEELLPQSDVITLHVPLTPSTRGLIDADAFTRMKPTAILINAARAGVVDEAALLQALRSKTIFGAALDATDVEPPTMEAYSEFLKHDNIILTPHVGGSTVENQSRSGVAVVKTLLAVLDGREATGRLA